MVRHILSAILVFLFWAALAAMVDANWSYRNGYYYWAGGSDAYTRSYVAPCYSCGNYQAGYYAYTFSHVYQPPLPSPTTSTNWRAEILKIAAQKQYLERESADFQAAVQTLGLGNQSGYGNYMNNIGAAQGSTAYGYTNQSTSTFYGDAALNLSAQFQSLARLAENSQTGTKQVTSDFADLLSQASDNQASIARIIAKGTVAAQVLQSMNENRATIKESSSSFKVEPNGGGNGQVPPWESSATAKCLQCHNGSGRKEGGLDLTQFRSFERGKRLQIVSRLVSQDESKRMPKGGPAITGPELNLWLSEAVK